MKYSISQTSYGALGSFFFWCRLSSHTTKTRIMELEVYRVHWQPATPPGIQHGKEGKPAPFIDLVLLSASQDFESFAVDTTA
jgi:hypothetical protein